MRISIITVTYNAEKFLKGCIESVLNQDFKEVEYIIIDGFSTDGTLEIIKSYPQIKYLSERDSGLYDAINKGIKFASGDIVGLLHSDDFFADTNVLSRVWASFEADQMLDCVFADVRFVKRTNADKVVRHYSSKFFKPWMFKFGMQPAHPTFYVKKNLFYKLGFYRTDLKIAGDFELLLRFLSKNRIYYKYVNDLWVIMRIGGVSTSGLSSIFKLNDEIFKAHQVNQLNTNKVLIYLKYLFKWWGFLNKT